MADVSVFTEGSLRLPSNTKSSVEVVLTGVYQRAVENAAQGTGVYTICRVPNVGLLPVGDVECLLSYATKRRHLLKKPVTSFTGTTVAGDSTRARYAEINRFALTQMDYVASYLLDRLASTVQTLTASMAPGPAHKYKLWTTVLVTPKMNSQYCPKVSLVNDVLQTARVHLTKTENVSCNELDCMGLHVDGLDGGSLLQLTMYLVLATCEAHTAVTNAYNDGIVLKVFVVMHGGNKGYANALSSGITLDPDPDIVNAVYTSLLTYDCDHCVFRTSGGKDHMTMDVPESSLWRKWFSDKGHEIGDAKIVAYALVHGSVLLVDSGEPHLVLNTNNSQAVAAQTNYCPPNGYV